MVKENEYSTVITGTIKNTLGKELGYVQIDINLYDNSGAQVGTTFANINNLEVDGIWNFSAMAYPDTSTSFKVKEITYW